MNIITALDPNVFDFTCKGYANIKISYIDDKGSPATKNVQIPIKAVNQEDAQNYVEEKILKRPKAPYRRSNIDGKYVKEADLTDDRYNEELMAYNKAVAECWVLWAIDVDIKDDKGDVVWSANNIIKDYKKAMDVLTNSLHLVQMQFIDILRQVRTLAQFEEEQELED